MQGPISVQVLGDADDGFGEVFFREADAAQVGAGCGAGGAFGEDAGVCFAGDGGHVFLCAQGLMGEAVLGAGVVVGWLRGGEGVEVGGEVVDHFVEVAVAVLLESGVVGAFGE